MSKQTGMERSLVLMHMCILKIMKVYLGDVLYDV